MYIVHVISIFKPIYISWCLHYRRNDIPYIRTSNRAKVKIRACDSGIGAIAGWWRFFGSAISLLVSYMRLYKPLCRSVGWSVDRLVGWSVGWLVGWSVGRSVADCSEHATSEQSKSSKRSQAIWESRATKKASHPASQPTNQPTNWPINQPTNQQTN